MIRGTAVADDTQHCVICFSEFIYYMLYSLNKETYHHAYILFNFLFDITKCN